MRLRVEFTVEPFVAGLPGPHVQAALDAAEAVGVRVAFGPFGTAFEAPGDDALTAVDAIVRAATTAGATRVSVMVEQT